MGKHRPTDAPRFWEGQGFIAVIAAGVFGLAGAALAIQAVVS